MFDIFAHPVGELLPFFLVGFVAQIIDGALGMAFGVIANTLLISLGVPPASASAGVHMIKNFTGAASGISHVIHRNVDWRLFVRILVPGLIGGVAGAWLLTLISAETARPIVLGYLSLIGIFLLWRGAMHRHVEREPKIVEPLGLAGGFLDAAGGGGWGPVVTSNLLVQGANPRKVIGTCKHGRIFPRARHLGHLCRNVGPGGLYRRNCGTADRRCDRRAAGSAHRQADRDGPAAHDGRHRADGDQPLRPLSGPRLICSCGGALEPDRLRWKRFALPPKA